MGDRSGLLNEELMVCIRYFFVQMETIELVNLWAFFVILIILVSLVLIKKRKD